MPHASIRLIALLAALSVFAQAAAGEARNVILFIGDGMGVSTLTSARIFDGQQKGVDGASNRLSFEKFPNLALVKTYSADSLVTDSANGASAMLTGVRTLNGALGVDATVKRDDCKSIPAAWVETLAEQAKTAGLSTGAVSTAAITDATPASLYAHTGTRGAQGDFQMTKPDVEAGCLDIARQLVDAPESTRLNLALGGGAQFFTSFERLDGRDLTREWAKRPSSAYVETAAGLKAVPKSTRYVLGLFANNNMVRETDRPNQAADAPRLVDMTREAITRLSQNPKGYFLMVEGGLIDKAHHVGLVHEALNETREFDQAVAAAVAMTDPKDTLIIVTADHSHGLTLSGGARNSPILGLVTGLDGSPRLANDGKPYAILNYATGPGGPGPDETRFDPSTVDTTDPTYKAQATIGLASANHTGEDVAAYAQGPGAQRLHGLIEQPDIYEAMRLALGLPKPKRGAPAP